MSYPTMTYYNNVTGYILGSAQGDEETINANKPEGAEIIEGSFSGEHFYIQDGSAVERPALILILSRTTVTADGIDYVLIEGIPEGATIRDDNDSITSDGAVVEFVSDIVGEHKFWVSAWPYQDAEVIINAI